MKEITHNGARFWFLSACPDWDSRVSVSFRKPVNVERARNGGEVRRLTGQTLRIRQEFAALVSGETRDALEGWLAEHRTELVGVPLWALLSGARDPLLPISAELWAASSCAGDRVEVFSGSVPGWCTEDDNVCPIVLGRLDSRKLSRINPTWSRFDVAHTEDCLEEFSVEFSEFQDIPGPRHDPAGRPPFALFHEPFDFAAPEQSAALEVDRSEIGFSRQTEQRADGAPALELSLDCSPNHPIELCRVLGFFAARSSATPFWIPTDGEAFQCPDLADGVKFIPGTFPRISSGDWLAFREPNQIPRYAAVHEVRSGGFTLSASPGPCFALSTVASRMLLVRFQSDRLSVDFYAPGMATVRLDLREVRAEQESEIRTVPGVNIGAAAPRVWLYEITSGEQTERWTSFDSELRAGGFLWRPCRITHGGFEDSVTGFRGSVKLSVGATASALVSEALGRRISGRLAVSVFVGELAGDSANGLETVFAGEVDKLSLGGVVVSLSCLPFPRLNELRIPRIRIQPACNHVVFRGGCRLIESEWEWTGTVSDPGLPGFPHAFEVSGIDGPGEVSRENWFAGGWADFGMDRVPVRSCSEPESGTLSLVLARDPRPYPRAGDSVSLFPGCDGAADTCREKFHNFDNFGGHPFVPTSNPTLVQLSPAYSGGKK